MLNLTKFFYISGGKNIVLFDELKICDSELSFVEVNASGLTRAHYKSEFILILDPDSYWEKKQQICNQLKKINLKYNFQFYV